ncbi:MAG: hypothetical protein KF835_15015 [Xanthobacteraceae bacterium]|nr:hypothetical protein [Xanthobacteraceae bacterium]
MKREIAATIFSMLLAGTAIAGPIETSELPPPSQNETPDSAQLRGLIEATQNAHKRAQSQTSSHEDWEAYSADFWLTEIPEGGDVLLDALAQRIKRYPSYGAISDQNQSIPTSLSLNRGNWKANVGANVTTATAPATVIPVEAYAGSITAYGGTGAIDGRLEYDTNSWQFYGGTKSGLVANANGTLGLSNNFTGGTYYNLPQSLLGGKIGTGLEVNPLADTKTTKLEYRQTFGNTEGFVSAERTTPWAVIPSQEISPVNALKAGINRKF